MEDRLVYGLSSIMETVNQRPAQVIPIRPFRFIRYRHTDAAALLIGSPDAVETLEADLPALALEELEILAGGDFWDDEYAPGTGGVSGG